MRSLDRLRFYIMFLQEVKSDEALPVVGSKSRTCCGTADSHHRGRGYSMMLLLLSACCTYGFIIEAIYKTFIIMYD